MSFGETFLTTPELFPVRISGERWGDLEYTLVIPGGPFTIAGLCGEQRASLVERFGEDSSRAPGEIELTLFRAPADDFLHIDTRAWEYRLDLDFRPGSISAAGMRFMARVDLDARRGGIWTSVANEAETWSVIENVLRPLVAVRLLDAGGLLVHSAAVVSEDRGFLFAGASGAGKSTIAAGALAAGRGVLSDDLNAIVPSGESFTLEPLPFTGDVERSQLSTVPAGLFAVVALRKGESEATAPLRRAEAAALLARSAPYVNLDPARAGSLLDRAAALASCARTVTLTFRRDANVWPILDSL